MRWLSSIPALIKKGIGSSSNPVWRDVLIVCTVIVILAGGTLFWFLPVLQRAEEDAVRLQRSDALRAENLLELFVSSTFNDIAIFGSELFIAAEEEDPGYSRALADSIFNGRKDILSILLLDKQARSIAGKYYRNGGNRGNLPAEKYGDSVFFQSALVGNRYISPVLFGADGPLLQIAAPVEIDGKIIGVIAAEFDFTLLWEIVRNISVENGKVYVVDEKGTIIADPNTARSRSGENMRYRDVVDKLVRGANEVPFVEYINEKKEEVISYGLLMDITGWGIIVEQLRGTVLAQRQRTFFVSLTFSAANILLIVLIVWNTLALVRALGRAGAEREERERIITFLPDGIIEYTGENLVLTINPAAKKFLNINAALPADGLYVSESAAPYAGFEKLWSIFFTKLQHEGGQGGSYEVALGNAGGVKLKVITVYVKGTGPLHEQRYLKILHDLTS